MGQAERDDVQAAANLLAHRWIQFADRVQCPLPLSHHKADEGRYPWRHPSTRSYQINPWGKAPTKNPPCPPTRAAKVHPDSPARERLRHRWKPPVHTPDPARGSTAG